ncbi:amino acid transporter [Aureobasidium subglaciale]|nr:amino acid transporter [Aureobasidium subglaciale]
MQEESIQKASSVEVTQQRKGNFLRPTAVRGDSSRSGYDDSGSVKDKIRPISSGFSRPRLLSTSSTYQSTSPAAKSPYRPEWAQDAEDVAVPPAILNEDGSPEDLKDMLRMGRTQEMRSVPTVLADIFRLPVRHADHASQDSVTDNSIQIARYMGVYFTLTRTSNNNQALEAGGSALLFWSYVWSFAGSLLVTASLAEMCSMLPSSAGQYFWVSEFASERWQQILSYITGWMQLVGWMCGNASGIFLTGSLFQSVITIYRPANGELLWETIVFLVPVVALVILANIYGGRTIAILQNISMSVHVLALIAMVGKLASRTPHKANTYQASAILGVLSPHIPAKRALLQVENTEWSTTALAMVAGQANANFSCFYSDCPIHLSEEVQNAAVVVPKATMRSSYISGALGLIAVTTFAFCVPSVTAALDHPTGYSLLYVLQLSVPNGVIVCILLTFIALIGASSIGFAATTARITYAFARDSGLPFSQWISKVHKGRLMPMNAVFLTAAVSVLLSLINLGSTTAFYGIVSVMPLRSGRPQTKRAQVGLGQATQSMSYIISIMCVLYRRIKSPEQLPPARWSLGRSWGPIINVFAILFSVNCFIWSLSPPTLPVTPTNFNIAGALILGIFILMLVTYYFRRKIYVGPVARTRDTPSWNLSQLGTGQNIQFVTIPEEV